MLLSIIIVNWNGQNFLRQCLQSIQLETQEIPYEIIVIDNASTDNSLQLLRNEFPDITLIINNENVGFAKANNQGIAQAKGDYIVLLNPDTEIKKQTLQKMAAYLDKHIDVGIVGPRLMLPNGSIQGGAAGYYPSISTILNYTLGLHALLPNHIHGLWLASKQYRAVELDVDWVAGACLMVRASVVKQVGHLNADYFMYAEDMEFCYRVKLAGWKIRCLPNLSIIHHIGGSIQQQKPQRIDQNISGLDQFYNQFHSRVIVALMHLEGVLAFGLRAVIYWFADKLRTQSDYQRSAIAMQRYAYSSLQYFLKSIGLTHYGQFS